MKTFSEFLNEQPANIKNAWSGVEVSWHGFLRELYDHLRDNVTKYDAHHSKFGGLSSEHPDESLNRSVRMIERGFKKLKEELLRLGAHEMI